MFFFYIMEAGGGAGSELEITAELRPIWSSRYPDNPFATSDWIVGRLLHY